MEIVFETDKKQDELPQHHAQQLCLIKYPFQSAPLRTVPIKESRVLVSGNGVKRILEISLDITEHEDLQHFQPGDTFGILPRNRAEEIEDLLAALQLTDKSHTGCRITLQQQQPKETKKPTKQPQHIPFGEIITPYEILRDLVNLHAVLKKQFLHSLAACCTQPSDCEFLCELASKEGKARYDELILQKGVTLAELLRTYAPSCQPTLVQLLEFLPPLLPRPYSVANRGHIHPEKEEQIDQSIGKELIFIFSIKTGVEAPGLTTGMLNELVASQQTTDNNDTIVPPQVHLYMRQPTTFRFTTIEAHEHNQLLIAIGTGVAPFIGFLELKEAIGREQTKEHLGETWLFVGATAPDNLPHRQRILQWKENGVLKQYHETFSRIQAEVNETDVEIPTSYRYIQDKLQEHSSAVVEFLMRPSTLLYVCADGAQISRSIDEALSACLQQELNKPSSECVNMLKQFQKDGKYRQDIWL